jgi:hypothetical protein
VVGPRLRSGKAETSPEAEARGRARRRPSPEAEAEAEAWGRARRRPSPMAEAEFGGDRDSVLPWWLAQQLERDE